MRQFNIVFRVEEVVDGEPMVLVDQHKTEVHFHDQDIEAVRKMAAMGFTMPEPDPAQGGQNLARWIAWRRPVSDKLEATTLVVYRFLLPKVLELLAKEPK